MEQNKIRAAFLVAVTAFFAMTSHAATTGPVSMDRASSPSGEEAAAQVETVQILGKALCSEYGSRHKEPLVVIFRSGDLTRTAEVNQDDGLFHVALPAGREYAFSIGMGGRSFRVGGFALPAGGPSRKVLEIHHPGSMLELVWEARAGDDGGGTDFKLKDADGNSPRPPVVREDAGGPP